MDLVISSYVCDSSYWSDSSDSSDNFFLSLNVTIQTQIVAKLRKLELWQHSYCDKIQKLNVEKKLNYEKTQKLKLCQNSKTQIVTKQQI